MYTDSELVRDWAARFSQNRKRILSPSSSVDSQIERSKELDAKTLWAFDELERLVRTEPARAWTIILAILEHSRDDEGVLDNLSAGPLESLLATHGRMALEWVENEACRNPRFKDLLHGVWQNAMPELIWQRVLKARE